MNKNYMFVYTGGNANLKESFEKGNIIDLGELGSNLLWVSLSSDYAYSHSLKPGRVLWQIGFRKDIWIMGRNLGKIQNCEKNKFMNFTIEENFISDHVRNNTDKIPKITFVEIKDYWPGKFQ